MKKLWARIGTTVEITDEEHEKLKVLFQENEDEARKVLTQLFVKRGYLNGDSYMPDGCADNPNEDEFDLLEVL